MKVRWWVVGIVAVVVGGIVMMKHFVEPRKTYLPYSSKNGEHSTGKISHKMPDTDLDDINFIV